MTRTRTRTDIRRTTARGDAGVSLVEVLVSMAIMSVIMVIFTGGLLQMYGLSNTNESVSTAQQRLTVAFQRLDKEIRYAYGISKPCQSGSVPACPAGTTASVEYLALRTAAGPACGTRSPTVATYCCNQVRLVPDGTSGTFQLRHRSWPQGSLSEMGGWVPLAFAVSSQQPFTFVDPTEAASFQKLRIQLTTTAGTGKDAASSQSDVTFTALNTTYKTASATTCTEGRTVS